MQKIIKVKLKCGNTGETYYENRVVTILNEQEKAINAARERNERDTDAQADHEGRMIRRHRAIRPDMQKVGWMGRN